MVVREERYVTDTYISPKGVVIVITGVPAHVISLPDDGEQIIYDFDVAERLDSITLAALAEPAQAGTVKSYAFEQQAISQLEQ